LIDGTATSFNGVDEHPGNNRQRSVVASELFSGAILSVGGAHETFMATDKRFCRAAKLLGGSHQCCLNTTM